jgi:hypothetical protein
MLVAVHRHGRDSVSVWLPRASEEAPCRSPACPVQFVGLARDLIRRVDKNDDKVVTVLAVASLPLIKRKRTSRTLAPVWHR